MLRKEEKLSDQSLRSMHADSAPKLFNQMKASSKNISQPSFIEVLDEVSVVVLDGEVFVELCRVLMSASGLGHRTIVTNPP
jgi:uncharacterized protein (DUF1786 family)